MKEITQRKHSNSFFQRFKNATYLVYRTGWSEGLHKIKAAVLTRIQFSQAKLNTLHLVPFSSKGNNCLCLYIDNLLVFSAKQFNKYNRKRVHLTTILQKKHVCKTLLYSYYRKPISQQRLVPIGVNFSMRIKMKFQAYTLCVCLFGFYLVKRIALVTVSFWETVSRVCTYKRAS